MPCVPATANARTENHSDSCRSESLASLPLQPGHSMASLVAAAGEENHHDVVGLPLGRDAHGLDHGMGCFQGRQNAFQPRAQPERLQRLVIADTSIAHSAAVLPVAVFG